MKDRITFLYYLFEMAELEQVIWGREKTAKTLLGLKSEDRKRNLQFIYGANANKFPKGR